MKLKAILEKVDDLSEDFRSLYTERNGRWELTGIEGVKTQADIDRLQEAMAKERKFSRDLKDKYAAIDSMDMADIMSKLDTYDELKVRAEGSLDEDKMNGIVESRLKAKLAPVERDLATALQEKDSLKAENDKYIHAERIAKIHKEVAEAGKASNGYNMDALEDTQMHAERIFEIDEAGRVVTRDGVGVTPGIEAKAWLLDMQQKRSIWWGESRGSGMSGGNRGAGMAANPWKKGSINLTDQGRIYRENPALAEQMRKVAGS